MVFEVVFFFLSLTALGFWLLTSDAVADWRRIIRARHVRRLMRSLDGKPITQAEAVLGPPSEIIDGAGGRHLYVWKGPDVQSIPSAPSLLIITMTVDSAGVVTHVAVEER